MSPTFCPECRKGVEAADESCSACRLARPPGGWPLDPHIGRIVAQKYRLEERLGAGGMAAVFRAVQIHGTQELGGVVLKFLHAELAQAPSLRARFVAEARAAREVTSPHVVKVFDLGFDGDGSPFLVMEFLEGESLSELLQRTPALPPPRALRIALQVAGAMDQCHKKRIVHRDLKPGNILLLHDREGDFVKVIDFGIARVPRSDGQVTHTLMGTPRYMPPEQLLQQEIDGRVDVYALGVILFEMLTGEPPIQARTPMEYVQLNLQAPPRRLRDVRPGLPAALDDLVLRMLAKSAADRPPTMGHVYTELRAIAVKSAWMSDDSLIVPAARPAIDATTPLLESVPPANVPTRPFGNVTATWRKILPPRRALAAGAILALLGAVLWLAIRRPTAAPVPQAGQEDAPPPRVAPATRDALPRGPTAPASPPTTAQAPPERLAPSQVAQEAGPEARTADSPSRKKASPNPQPRDPWAPVQER